MASSLFSICGIVTIEVKRGRFCAFCGRAVYPCSWYATLHSRNTINTLYYTYYTVEECSILDLYFPHIEGEECILAATGPPHSTLVAQMAIAQLCASLALP